MDPVLLMLRMVRRRHLLVLIGLTLHLAHVSASDPGDEAHGKKATAAHPPAKPSSAPGSSKPKPPGLRCGTA
jgi:hypothetical protein